MNTFVKATGIILTLSLSYSKNMEAQIVVRNPNIHDSIILSSNGNPSDIKEAEPVFSYVEQMPEYTGGEAALLEFLKKNIKYPKEARELGIEGKVMAKFIVKTDGSLDDINILRGLGHGCDEEVIRVLGIMPKWRPGKQNGKAVQSFFTLPVSFKMK